MQIDVELALADALTDEIDKFQSNLPLGFYIEDCSDRGWGLVIRTTQKLSDEFNEAINTFLESLSSLMKIINSYERLLRIGIFYNTATCTVQLKSYERLAAFRIPMEISMYPTLDE